MGDENQQMQALLQPRATPWGAGDVAAAILASFTQGIRRQREEALTTQGRDYQMAQEAYREQTDRINQQVNTLFQAAQGAQDPQQRAALMAQAIALAKTVPSPPGRPALQAPPSILGNLLPKPTPPTPPQGMVPAAAARAPSPGPFVPVPPEDPMAAAERILRTPSTETIGTHATTKAAKDFLARQNIKEDTSTSQAQALYPHILEDLTRLNAPAGKPLVELPGFASAKGTPAEKIIIPNDAVTGEPDMLYATTIADRFKIPLSDEDRERARAARAAALHRGLIGAILGKDNKMLADVKRQAATWMSPAEIFAETKTARAEAAQVNAAQPTDAEGRPYTVMIGGKPHPVSNFGQKMQLDAEEAFRQQDYARQRADRQADIAQARAQQLADQVLQILHETDGHLVTAEDKASSAAAALHWATTRSKTLHQDADKATAAGDRDLANQYKEQARAVDSQILALQADDAAAKASVKTWQSRWLKEREQVKGSQIVDVLPDPRTTRVGEVYMDPATGRKMQNNGQQWVPAP